MGTGLSLEEKKRHKRKEAKEILSALPLDYRQETDRLILQHVREAEFFLNSKSIMVYVSQSWEIETLPLLEHILKKDKDLYLPRVKEKGIMEAVQVKDLKSLEVGSFCIAEPGRKAEALWDTNILDLVIVPGLSFGKKGERLGHGGGYYDRFLKGYTGVKVGLCREMMLSTHIPLQEHDIGMDVVISEAGLYMVKT